MAKEKQSKILSDETRKQAATRSRIGIESIADRLERGERVSFLTMDECAEMLGDGVGAEFVEQGSFYQILSTALKDGRLTPDTWIDRAWPITALRAQHHNIRARPAFTGPTLRRFFDGKTDSIQLNLWMESDSEEPFEPSDPFHPAEFLNNHYRQQFANEAVKRLTNEGETDPTKKQLLDRCRTMASASWPTLFKASDSELTAIFLDGVQLNGARP